MVLRALRCQEREQRLSQYSKQVRLVASWLIAEKDPSDLSPSLELNGRHVILIEQAAIPRPAAVQLPELACIASVARNLLRGSAGTGKPSGAAPYRNM